ncbi:unnamed protein product [Cylicostephanus goldi]|uniref:Uncharacterized protein n=1 Tax=Cylicostephanus goldi TaxID=71465 RepID=A0A3P6R225_CYLGO|nr:unnamed protein product [Cylicostephanus goldi]
MCFHIDSFKGDGGSPCFENKKDSVEDVEVLYLRRPLQKRKDTKLHDNVVRLRKGIGRGHIYEIQELLDQILLWVGLVGELIYSVAGIVGLTGDGPWEPLVGSQTFLIYLASKVKVGDSSKERQPGKQAITFLLAANLSIFFMNLFESEKPGVSENIIDFYGKRSWVFLVRSFSPLTIFYRFHSSVCLAEIWKNVYANK